MKKIVVAAVMFAIAFSGCASIKKATSKISGDDIKAIADKINMDFGSGPEGPFKTEKAATSDSILVIKNSTDRTIKVEAIGVTKKTFVVQSGKADKADVKPGAYHFKASAEGTKGCEGDATLKGFNQYTWEFIIK